MCKHENTMNQTFNKSSHRIGSDEQDETVDTITALADSSLTTVAAQTRCNTSTFEEGNEHDSFSTGSSESESDEQQLKYMQTASEVSIDDDDDASVSSVNPSIERVLAQRSGKKGCTGNQTTIYAIEENGCDPNADFDESSESTEVQYLIKWRGLSYIHNTWESETTLCDMKVKRMKILNKFIQKEQEQACCSTDSEDIDYRLELRQDLIKSYNNVDRIIAHRTKCDDGKEEFLCKWQSLPYDKSTWEDAALVLHQWQSNVQQFRDRERSKHTPSEDCEVIKHRPEFSRIRSQPDFLREGLTLHDFQMDGLNWLLHSWCKENSVILADEMGLGETIQSICFLYSLFKLHHLYGPFLCVVPLTTKTIWQREFDLWAPDMNVVTYSGDIKARELIQKYEWHFEGSKKLKFNCILTSYEILLKDKQFLGTLQWAALVVAEAHRLKNNDSQLYKSLNKFHTNHRLLITGTPFQNSLKELWALLHFAMPKEFETWENFELLHHHADDTYTRVHHQLEPYLLRRLKKDVEKSLPAKVEHILWTKMTSLQKKYYKWILTKNFDALSKGRRGSTTTFLNIAQKLKKCCNHAALIMPSAFALHGLQPNEALQKLFKGSGKLTLLDKLLCFLQRTGQRVIIFAQLIRVLDLLADYLRLRHFSFQRLDGNIREDLRSQAVDHFNAEGSHDFCFLLSTHAGGLGINLATADNVIIFDSDWNPHNDLQAQARAHRIGQKNQVKVYRLVTARSIEEKIVERAKRKMELDHLVMQRLHSTEGMLLDESGNGDSFNSNPLNKGDLSAMLKFGAKELFQDEQEHEEELLSDIEDPELSGENFLSFFQVSSIATLQEDQLTGIDEDDSNNWCDIIPEHYRCSGDENGAKTYLQQLDEQLKKPLAELNRIAKTLHDRCVQFTEQKLG